MKRLCITFSNWMMILKATTNFKTLKFSFFIQVPEHITVILFLTINTTQIPPNAPGLKPHPSLSDGGGLYYYVGGASSASCRVGST